MPDVTLAATLPAGSVPTDRIPLPAGALVVTDLHLVPLGDARTDAFVPWCDGLVDVPVLVCLGDLFEVWDSRNQARLSGCRPVFEAFRRLVERGTHVHRIPGNRDASLDDAFEGETGGSFHLEGFLADLDGGPRAAFVHGDALCTLDLSYLRLRRILRWEPLRFATRHGPMWLARRIGRRIRGASESAKPYKPPAEKSIQPDAVRALAQAAGASLVVCGHAHEVSDRVLPSDDGAPDVRWVVVGAWETDGDLLRVAEGGGIELASSATIPVRAPDGPRST